MQAFLEKGQAAETKPNAIRFLDAFHLSDINQIMHQDVFKKMAAVLFELGSAEDNSKFLKFVEETGGLEEAPPYVASYLWNERLFGMKTKRLGPTILASECIIPIASAAEFIAKAKKLGTHFGVEVFVDSYLLDSRKALVMTNFLCDSRKGKYFINLPLTMLFTRAAIGLGAEPYGLGIWNAPFIDSLYNGAKKRQLVAFKAKVDPNGVMNPGKFFRVRGKGMGIFATVFNPGLFSFSMSVLSGLSPVVGKIATMFMGKDKKVDELDFELTTHACAKCGNCIAVCPSYLVFKNEEVTAKGKIALAKKLIEGREITRQEAETVFMCMHCKACESICQTNLELMRLWDALESRMESKIGGRPEEKIAQFLKTVDESQEYWDMVERNS